jgi:hypothetical protein
MTKLAAIVFLCLLPGTKARSECVTVEALKPQEASSHVRIAVMLGNVPLKDVKVDFIQSPDQQLYSVLTDEHGIAAPHELAPGDYNVVATRNDGVSTFLWLRVGANHGAVLLSIDLTSADRLAQQLLKVLQDGARELPIREHVRVFRGNVVDPSGAFVPGTTITVVRKGPMKNAVVLQMKSDAAGQFAAQLDEGVYIAFFSAQGFAPATVPFELTSAGSGDLRVPLTLGQC